MKIREVKFVYSWLEFKAVGVDFDEEGEGIEFDSLYIRDHGMDFRRVPDTLADYLINNPKVYRKLLKECRKFIKPEERCPVCGDPDPETCRCSMDF